jgi:hypothetical protein
MPLQKLQFRPGVNREGTNYSNEGGWYASDKIRFRSGYPQKLGGWANITSSGSTYYGMARILWNWATNAGASLIGMGTTKKLYVYGSPTYHDITPLRDTNVLTDPFATTNGSKLVTVTDTGHGANVGTYVNFSGASAVGGLTLDGDFEILTATANTYTIASPTAATSTVASGGGTVTAEYDINATDTSSYTTGWGDPPWGYGTWGGGLATVLGPATRLWAIDNYGQDMVANVRNGAIYYWEQDTSTWARAITLQAAADAAGYNAIVYGSYEQWQYVPNQTYQVLTSGVSRFVIAMGANSYLNTDPDTAFDPMLVRWSDQENVYDWIPSTTNQAGEQRLSNGSYIMTARASRQEILIWTDAALFSMQYLGPPYVWGFNLLMDNTSIAGPEAAVTVNNITFWMGVDKFYMYSGRVETLPCSLRQYVFNNINRSLLELVVAGTNEGFNEVWWLYPSVNSSFNDRYVIYNYLERIWYYGTLDRSTWLDSPLQLYPMGAFSVQNSYLNQAMDATQTTINLINGANYPTEGTVTIDSEQITYTGVSNNTLTGCVRGANSTTAASHSAYSSVMYNVPNQLLYHEYGVDDNSGSTPVAIDAYIQSSDFDIGDGHNFGFVWRVLPDLTFNGSTSDRPVATMVLKPRVNSGTAYGAPDPNNVQSEDNFMLSRNYNVETFTGQVYTRLRGRQMAFRIESDTTGVNWQLGTPRIDIRPDGRR